MNTTPESLLFIGRLHPLLVHLPIGLIVLLAFLEFLALFPRFKHVNAGAGVILAFALPMSVFTVACGYVLSLGGGYDTKLLQWHQWAGFATLGICLISGLLFWMNLKTVYRLCIFVSFAVLVVASHFGGSLTHGKDYLTRYAPAPIQNLLGYRPPGSPAKASGIADQDAPLSAFEAIVLPVLHENCVSCHGPEKRKGGFQADTFEGLLKGGEHGPAIVPGKAAESEMVRRMRLPLEEEDHMPPEGKPQPSERDLALIEWWINSGASRDKAVTDLNPPQHIASMIARQGKGPAAAVAEPAAETGTPPVAREEILPAAAKLAQDLGIPITPLSEKDPWLQANASILGAKFGDAELEQLSTLGPNLKWLDMGGTKITDSGLEKLGAMPNLVRLHLERTGITDEGLTHLSRLAKLEYLNLYGSKVTDAGLETLRALPGLKQLYLWQTSVSPEAAKGFADSRIDKVQIEQWEQTIQQLQAKIRDMHMLVDVGSINVSTPSTQQAGPINTLCPVSGKPVDLAKTNTYEGVLVAFCCDDCKAKFQADPKAFRDRLSLKLASATATETAQAPANTKCPVSGKDVNSQITLFYDGRSLAFCCEDCKAKFQGDPKSYVEKLQVQPATPRPSANPKEKAN